MAIDITVLERLGLPDMVIWLLTFSVVYGLLSHTQLPRSNAARAMIAFVLAFFVMFAAPATLVTVLGKMSSSLILTVLGILVFIVFLEAIGMKKEEEVYAKDEKTGKPVLVGHRVYNIFQYYNKYFLAVFVIIAILIFIASGGLDLIGWKFQIGNISTTGIFFIITIILAILWLTLEKQ